MVAGTGIGQEYFSRRRKENFTTLARGFVLLNETSLRLAIPYASEAVHSLPAQSEDREKSRQAGFFSVLVAGAGLATEMENFGGTKIEREK